MRKLVLILEVDYDGDLSDEDPILITDRMYSAVRGIESDVLALPHACPIDVRVYAELEE